MEEAGEAVVRTPPPVRTFSGGPVIKVVGFQEPTETSPASVLRFQEDGAHSPSPAHAQRSQLGAGLALADSAQQLPKLTINVKRSVLKKSKSVADLRVAKPIPPAQPGTQPSSPQCSHSQGSSGPVNIPFELPRRQPWACVPNAAGEDGEEELQYIRSPFISAASSLVSHRAFSPSHRSFSTKELFEAQADIVTAQAQVAGLHSALKREHEEVVRLREQLSLVTAERDRLLQELREASTPRVFDMDDAPHALRTHFGGLSLR